MRLPKLTPLDLEPDHWRRCLECGGVLVRIAGPGDDGPDSPNLMGILIPENLAPHLGHRLISARGFHFWEYVRARLGYL